MEPVIVYFMFVSALWFVALLCLDRMKSTNVNRSENQTFSIIIGGNVNESARDQLEIVHQPSQKPSEYEIKIPDDEKSNLPPTYEESMRSIILTVEKQCGD